MHALVEVAPGNDPDLVSDRLRMFGAVGVEIRDDVVVGAFTDAAAADAAAVDLNGRCFTVGDTTGLDEWRDHAVVVAAGPFSIRPPWLDAGSGLDLVIDPGHAFGSGSHPSTQLALDLLADLVAPGISVADLGAGSGVLGIAAALLGADVITVDCDPEARRATLANAARNGVADRVEAITEDLAAVDLHADLTVLNVTIDIHEEVAPRLRNQALGPIIVSGILAGEQEHRCATAHDRVAARRVVQDEWAALVLDRGPDRSGS